MSTPFPEHIPKIDPEALETMRSAPRPGTVWAAYQNQAMDSAQHGHVSFLRCGEGCTFITPPVQYPDTALGPGWKYRHIGHVDLEAGKIILEKKEPTHE